MVQKTVNVKAKTDLKSSVKIWDADSYCLKNYHLSYNINLEI